MPVFKKFEDIKTWQEARSLVKLIYQITTEEPFNRDFGLRDQIRRASISILSNIAEGFERETTKEFIRFLFIAKAAAGEVRAQLYIANNLQYIAPAKSEELIDKCSKISRMIAKLSGYPFNSADLLFCKIVF